MPFAPRGSREKRSKILPPVRLDEEEFKIVEWLVERLSEQDGRRYTITDIVRMGLGKLHEAQSAIASPGQASGKRRSTRPGSRDLSAGE